MRRIAELNRDELADLTEEAIIRHIEIECAYNGVPPLPSTPPEDPRERKIVGDVLVWRLGDLHFTSETDALSIQSILHSMTSLVAPDYLPGASYEQKKVKPSGPPQVQTARFFSDEQWERERQHIQSLNEWLARWNREKEEFDRIRAQREDIEDDVRMRVESARDWHRRRDNAQREWDRLVGLAEGDHNIARRFFEKMYPEEFKEFGDVMTTVPVRGEANVIAFMEIGGDSERPLDIVPAPEETGPIPNDFGKWGDQL